MVALGRLRVRFDFLGSEEKPEHATHAVRGERNAGFRRGCGERVGEQARAAVQLLVEARRLDQLEHRKARSHRNRISA